MQITKSQSIILSLLINRQGGQYDADIVKISHGALMRSSIRAQLVGLEMRGCVRREQDARGYPVGQPLMARWFITDGGRRAVAATQPLSEDALVVLQQAVQIAKDEQIQQLDDLRVRLLAFYPDRETLVDAALARWSAYVASAA